jgi:hypothetical protein
MLPIILGVVIIEKLMSYTGVTLRQVDDLIQTFYPHVWP